MKKVLGPLVAAAFCGALLTLGVGQEIPVGRLTGHISMKENGRPLAGALVTLSLKGAPDDERPTVKGVETDAQGDYAFGNLPAGDYTVEVSAKEHHAKPSRVTIAEGKTKTATFAAKPDEPYLTLYASQKVFTPGETPKVELHGFVPQKAVRLRIVRLDADRIARDGGYAQAIAPLARPDDATKLTQVGTRIVDEDKPVADRDAEGAFVETLPVGTLKEGAYFVQCRAGEKQAQTVLLVSRLALVAKTGHDGHALLYTTDLATGKPVGGVPISGAGSQDLGRTGANGLLDLKLPTPTEGVQRVFMARHGDSVALVNAFEGRFDAAKVWIDLYCERPAYRPGDPVQFKGFVRRVDGDGYRLPGAGTVHATVKDPDGNPLQTLSLPLSSHGSFHGTFTTSKEAKPGNYDIDCAALGGKREGVYANVVAYRKPEFSIVVTPNRDHYAMGDRASATVECKYYYGGPVVGAKVKATVYRSPVFAYEDGDGETQDGDSYGGGEYSQEVTGVTDASGRARITFDTRGENDPEVLTNDYDYTVSAAVTEDGGKLFDGEGKVRVTRGDFGMSMEVQNPILVPGDAAQLLIRTTAPTDPKKPVGGRIVTVESGIEAYAKGGSTFVRRDEFKAITGADGTALLRVPIAKADSLTFRASSHDDAGRPIVAEAWAYVEGSSATAEARRGELKLTLDKRDYTDGQKAKVLIETDTPGGTGLVTVQTDRVLWKRLVPLTSGSTLIEVPVVKEYAPNIYVSVVYVREKRFLQADRRLRVSREDRRLLVQVRPSKGVYLPGSTAQVTVRTTDTDGKPVPAEVSLGTVDRGVYDIASDDTDLYASLYPARSNGVSTDYSFPEIYLDGGDKGTSKVPLRKEFRDTAAWTPAVWTGLSGEATVAVPLPDNLTEWRVTAVGMSDASQTGLATASFRASKPLMVRLGLPQFLVAGDTQRLTATIANGTGRDAEVILNFGTKGLRLTNEPPKSIHVPAGTPQTVDLDVEALGAGTASVTVRGLIAGGESDGVEQSFPILAYGRPVLDTRAGEGDADFSLPLAENLDPKAGSLKITVSPTLAGDLGKALDGLIDFPYGCVEQTMSRFMPAILVGKTVRDLGLPVPRRLGKLPQIARDSLTRLARMRHEDGGWGWWEYDESEPFMTALVLDGLDRAKRAGYDVDLANPQAAVKWSMDYLGDPKRSKDASDRDRLYLAYALLRWGERNAAGLLKAIDLQDRVNKEGVRHPSAAELATAAMAYQAAGRDAGPLLDRLERRANVGEETATWAPEEGAWGDETTALALVAIQASRPDDPLLPRIVRGLLDERRGDGWASTRDTAYALVGLTAYLDHTKELAGASTATIIVNGKPRGTFALDPRAADPSRTVEIPRSELGNEAKVEIRTTGRVYRTVALSAFEVARPLLEKATDRDLTVSRRTFPMEPRRGRDGELRLLPSERPVTEFKNGDVVRVELTIHSDVPREFVLVEEPTPSSCRVSERTDLEEGETKDWWWSRTVVLDDHLAFFARNLPAGDSQIVYYMRAEEAGQAVTLPARAENMYDPGRWASTAETRIRVTK